MNPERLKPKHAVVLEALLTADKAPTRGELMEMVRSQITGSLTLAVLYHATSELREAGLIDMHPINLKCFVYRITADGMVALKRYRREERVELATHDRPGVALPCRIDKLNAPVLAVIPHLSGYCRNNGNKHIGSVGAGC